MLAGVVPLAAAPVAGAALARGRRHLAALALAAAVAELSLRSITSAAASPGTPSSSWAAHPYQVSYGGRGFRLESATAARDLQRAVATEARLARAGSRLFVGPSDLRRTAKNDAFVYYLLPAQRPASFYVELDPVASRRHSSLARDLEHADFLTLGRRWNLVRERNASRRYGDDAANRVVARLFCRRARFGGYDVLARCR